MPQCVLPSVSLCVEPPSELVEQVRPVKLKESGGSASTVARSKLGVQSDFLFGRPVAVGRFTFGVKAVAMKFSATPVRWADSPPGVGDTAWQLRRIE